jgi:hypothetical protein
MGFLVFNLVGVALVAIYLFIKYEVTNIISIKKPFDSKDIAVLFICVPVVPMGFIILAITLSLCCLIRICWRKLIGRIR